MDQFRQVGEVLGSLGALMVLKHDIQINQKQCCLLFDMFTLAFETISEEIRQNLRLEEKTTKWKPLENPMRELHKIFKEGELYIKNCLEIKDWWGKAISLHHNKDCVEFHIHNLLSCFPIVIEAIETASEVSGLDEEEMQKRKLVLMKKYDAELNDPRFFKWKFGKQYLVPRETSTRLDSAWKEDKWALVEAMRERKSIAHTFTRKHEEKLEGFLLEKLNGADDLKLLPSLILVGAKDYNMKRRLGSGGSHHKEIQWLGESFALRTFFGEIDPLKVEISLVLSLSHPNVLQYLCGFYDEERKEGFLVMELMQKSLFTYIKENCGQRKRVPFSLPVAIDIMLQIARGMEYLHSRKIYHGDLNPSNVLLKARSSSPEGYFQVKVKGFGLISIKSYARVSPRQSEVGPVIWYAPEVLAEQLRPPNKCSSKYTEKADVYSFAMLCFELLTGKVPFEDSHLQGDKMVRNIRAGERPLFPHPFPKYLANLTRKCWQTNPFHRPSFSSICRILRYIKKILVINPDHGQPECPPPLVDYLDLEAGYSKKYPEDGSFDLAPVHQIPFQMFAYRLVEKEKSSDNSLGRSWDSPMDDQSALVDDLPGPDDRRSVCSEILERKNSFTTLADQRSVFSEAPRRKFFSVDQMSVCSESPRGKLCSSVFAETPDRKSFGSVFAETPERKYFGSVFEETPEKIYLSRVSTLPRVVTGEKSPHSETSGESKPVKAGDSRSVSSITPERKLSSIKASEDKSAVFNIQEEETLAAAVADLVSPTVAETDSLSLRSDPKPQPHETAETQTEMKRTMAPHQSPITPEIPEKRADSTKGNVQKRGRAKIPEYKSESTKSLNDAKLGKIRTVKRQSPKSSPAQASKGYSSPKSSPVRTSTGYLSARTSPARNVKGCSSPGSSPARIFKGCSSPGSSPARIFKGCSNAGSSPTWTPNICSSPRSSPLNPCTRCSRMNKEHLIPSDMSPHLQRAGHVSESDVEIAKGPRH